MGHCLIPIPAPRVEHGGLVKIYALKLLLASSFLCSSSVTWMTIREALPEEHSSTTMETTRAQLIAMVVEFIPRAWAGMKEDDLHYVSEDDATDLFNMDNVDCLCR